MIRSADLLLSTAIHKFSELVNGEKVLTRIKDRMVCLS